MSNLNHQNLFDQLISISILQQADLDFIKVDPRSSKNFNWVIELPRNNCKLIIKQQPHYTTLNHDDRILKEWHVCNFLENEKDLEYASSITSETLYFDNENSILVSKYSDDYISLRSYYENDQSFPNTIAELVGITLAKLHSETRKTQNCHTFMAKFEQGKLHCQLPYPDHLSDYLINRVEPEHLRKIPANAWRFLGVFQHSEEVRKVVEELVLNHRRYCLTHNNTQFHKILISKQWEKSLAKSHDYDRSLIKLVDWEACSWGDPACDLGKAMAGYFLFWLNSMIVHPNIELKKSIQLAAISLENVRPSIASMTKAYIKTYPNILEDYPKFIERVIQFAGLALIYEILALIQSHQETYLNRQDVYFSIAQQLLCRPERFLLV